MKIVYFGTPIFAADILRYLLEKKVPIAAVVTQPDRPKGRSLQLGSSPVKTLLQEMAPTIPILQPVKCSNPEFLSQLAAIEADLYLVVAFGQILPQKLLDIPPLGSINVHPSLLPKYRGAAPIQRSLFFGEKETGVTIQKIVLQLDAGDVIAAVKTDVSPEITYGELEDKLCKLAQPLLYSVIQWYEKGVPAGEAQDPSLVTYASKIEPEEGEIDWKKPAAELHNKIRAFNPRPGAWCTVQSKRLKILRSQVASSQGKPGEILSLKDAVIGCGQDALKLLEVQPEGKRPMNGADWLRGQKFSSNSIF